MKQISTCLWFDHQAEEVAKYYTSIFTNSEMGRITRYGKAGAKVSGQKEGSVMSVEMRIENMEIMGLNGGPIFKFTQALSFFMSCATEKEIDEKWAQLSKGGKVRMGLDQYPWAPKYGWVADKFGVEWQLILSPKDQKIAPAFLFVDELFGKGEEAINFYMSLFPNSKIQTIARDEKTKTIMHCAFTLNGQEFVLMEGPGNHNAPFTNATSLVIPCENQGEIDRLWEKLSDGGTIEECGWLKDKFGVSWQVVPAEMQNLMNDPTKSERVMEAMLTMKKLDIAALKQAAK